MSVLTIAAPSTATTDIYNTQDFNTTDVYVLADPTPYDNRGGYYVPQRACATVGRGLDTLRSFARSISFKGDVA